MLKDINEYTGTKPEGYKLNGNFYKAETWADMAVSLFENLYKLDGKTFENLAERKFKNPKSPLISNCDYDILNRSRKLGNAEIYIEMHHSTTSFIRFMTMVLKEFNLLEKFDIVLKESRNG